VRVWDRVEPERMCRQHLLGEHRELHAVYSMLLRGLGSGGGYRNHPEVRRWVGRKGALWRRHRALVEEMEARGYNHRSPLSGPKPRLVNGWPLPWDDQEAALRAKGCDCRV
jgi:hypothetical protein